MLFVDKNVGETPLELLERIRREHPELKEEKLSYAGRLDPMAEGQMLILVGDEENRDRAKFLSLDKEYVATFLVGMKTDSGDVLGLVKREDDVEKSLNKTDTICEIDKQSLERSVENLKKLKVQKYPWFSGRTVAGIKLFDHFKAGNLDIERPTKKIEVKEVELLGVENQNIGQIKNYIFNSITKVSGDFRQEKILATWRKFFENAQKNEIKELQIFHVRILVSSGTFIRAFTENFDFPVALLKLQRTRVIL